MTWSYDAALSTQKDRVRLIVGDVDSADPLVSDEGISLYCTGGVLAQSSDRLAAAAVADAIAAKFARRPLGLQAGGTQVNWGVQSKRYSDLADQLRKEEIRTGAGVAVYLGGRSLADKRAREDDADRVPPAFTRTLGDADTALAATGDWDKP